MEVFPLTFKDVLLLVIVLQKEETQPVAKVLIIFQRREPIHQKVTFLDLLREGVSETVDVVFILHQCEYQPT